MTVCGKVIRKKEKTVLVKTQRPASCEGCTNAGICNKKELEIEALNTLSANEGDWVKINLPEDRKALFLLGYIFLVPVGILLLSAWLYTKNVFLTFAALPMLAGYLVYLKQLNRTHKTVNYTIEIISPAGDRAE